MWVLPLLGGCGLCPRGGHSQPAPTLQNPGPSEGCGRARAPQANVISRANMPNPQGQGELKQQGSAHWATVGTKRQSMGPWDVSEVLSSGQYKDRTERDIS